MKTRFTLALVCLVAAAVAVQANLTFSWKPKVGEVRVHAVSVTSKDENGTEVVFKMDRQSKVLSVDSKKVKIEGTIKNIRLTLNGQDLGDPSGAESAPAETAEVALNGEIIEPANADENPSHRTSQIFAFTYPDKDVSLGDSWVRKYKGKGATPSSEATFKYAGKEAKNGADCYKVSVEFKETSGDKPTTATATAWFRVTDGELIKWDGTIHNAVWQPGLPPAEATMTIELKS